MERGKTKEVTKQPRGEVSFTKVGSNTKSFGTSEHID
jgi:hypothetical protein